MPIFEITAPDGKVYEVEGPEGSTEEQALAQLQATLGAAPAGPAPTPAPAPPAPPGGPVGGGVAAPIAAAGGGPPVPAPTRDEIFAQLQAENAASMSIPEKVAAGAGQSVASTIRGGRQLFNYLTGDKEEYQQLLDEENEARRMDEALLDTGAGRTGQIGGHVLQALLPAGAVAKAGRAASLGLPGIMAAEGALGAGMGAVQPVAGDEKRSTNVIGGGILGAALPGVAAAGRLPQTLLGNTMSMLAPRGTGTLAHLASRLRPGSDKVRRIAGERIGQIVEDVRVPVTKEMARKLRDVQRDYGTSLPKSVRTKLNDWIELAESGNAKMKGQALQEARSALGAQAKEVGGIQASGLNRTKRVLDEALEGSMSKAKIRALREARATYRTGVKPVSTFSPSRTGTRGLVQALRAGSLPIYDDEETRN